MGKLTEAQRVALDYVSATMGTNVHAVGRHVVSIIGVRGGSDYQGIGSAILMHLRRKGFVNRSSDTGWRTTPAGRSALEQEKRG